jgi:WD40 repeat protein
VAQDLSRASAEWQLNGKGGIVTVCHADGSASEDFSGFPTDIDSFDCNSDMTRFVVGRENGDCQLRRLDDRTADPLDARAHLNGCVMTVAFSPDGTRYATGGWDSLVKIWTSNGTVERILDGNTHPIYKFWWSKDGKRLVSSSRSGTFCKWSVDDGRLESLLILSAAAQPLCVANDGRFDPAVQNLAANEIVVLLEKPNGSMEIVEYPEFLKRIGPAKR